MRRIVTEDLDSTQVEIEAVVIVHTRTGWHVAALASDDVTGDTVGDELGDCFAIAWDEAE